MSARTVSSSFLPVCPSHIDKFSSLFPYLFYFLIIYFFTLFIYHFILYRFFLFFSIFFPCVFFPSLLLYFYSFFFYHIWFFFIHCLSFLLFFFFSVYRSVILRFRLFHLFICDFCLFIFGVLYSVSFTAHDYGFFTLPVLSYSDCSVLVLCCLFVLSILPWDGLWCLVCDFMFSWVFGLFMFFSYDSFCVISHGFLVY